MRPRDQKKDEVMQPKNRIEVVDQLFDQKNVENRDYSDHLLVRVAAKKIYFNNIDFRYTIFDTCYFRKCVFNSCNFTGCQFKDSNLSGSNFEGCTFDYADFKNTHVDNSILDKGFSNRENLTLRFARTLRMNYQGLGDVESVNKAINFELYATEIHLKKAWRSKEPYYRDKYKGFERLWAFINWAIFKGLDFTWGNGESILKLLRTVVVLWFVMTLFHFFILDLSLRPKELLNIFLDMPSIFFSVEKPESYSSQVITIIYSFRLIFFALFMSILIRRFSRR